jgi:hypothetical protein
VKPRLLEAPPASTPAVLPVIEPVPKRAHGPAPAWREVDKASDFRNELVRTVFFALCALAAFVAAWVCSSLLF